MKLNEFQIEAVNHIDGPCLVTSCPGSGKCITGDSLIISNDVLVSEIQDNQVKRVIGLESEDFSNINSSSVNVSEFVNSGLQNTVRIVTKNGYSIEGTYHHPIVVLNKMGLFEWKYLDNIEVGDICPIWVNKEQFEYEVDEKFYLMGLLLGDGCLTRLEHNTLSFHSEKNNISHKYCDIVNKIYGYKCGEYKDKRRKNLYCFAINKKEIFSDLEKTFGDIFHLACDKYFTKEMLNGTKGQIASLIRGLFDTDGYAYGHGAGITLCSKKIINQLQIILLHYGVFSHKSIKKVKGKDYYRLEFFGNDYRRFVNNIGFFHAKKRSISLTILRKKKNANKIIPYVKDFVDNMVQKLSRCNHTWYNRKNQHLIEQGGTTLRLARQRSYSKNGRNITEDTVERIENIFNQYGYSDFNFDHIKDLNQYSFTEVSDKIYSSEVKNVYDYVIPKTHSFIANGFINHNTRVLVERVINLIKNGIKQKNILCITFTNKAGNEMKERICKSLNVKELDFYVGTFHSLCAKLLRKFEVEAGYEGFTILDDRDQVDLILQIARQKELELDKQDAWQIANCVNTYRDQLDEFQWVRDKLTNDTLSDIAEEYLLRCKETKQLDFSGLIYEAIQFLEKNDDIRGKLQNLFKYILVDETQDTNRSQFHLVKILGDKWKNIMIIGDLDQSVYRWRGARYENIQEFVSQYKDCRVISLSKNYRSTPQIIKAADRLIKNNSNRIDTKFETDNPSGEPVKCYQMPDQTNEAQWVANRIQRLMDEGGWDPKDIVILYRMNKMSEPLEQALAMKGIPYEVIGSWSFYDRREARDCVAMLKFLVNKRDGVAFHRVCSLLPGMGDVTIGKIENIAASKGINLVDACEEMSKIAKTAPIRDACGKLAKIYKSANYNQQFPSQCMYNLINSFEYEKLLTKEYKQDFQERIDNSKQVIESCSNFDGKDNGVHSFLQQISLVSANDKEVEGSKVALMSLHAAKGLEFSIVFMVGVEEQILPHFKCVADNPIDGLDEERRLCYVGMTRAKKILYITFCRIRKSFGKHGNAIIKQVRPSRFLFESGLLEEGKK